jgi:hypothetical protein
MSLVIGGKNRMSDWKKKLFGKGYGWFYIERVWGKEVDVKNFLYLVKIRKKLIFKLYK